MSEKIRLALVGCGGMAGAHLNAYGQLKQKGIDIFDIVSVCDPVTERAEDFAKRISDFQDELVPVIHSGLRLGILPITFIFTITQFSVIKKYQINN